MINRLHPLLALAALALIASPPASAAAETDAPGSALNGVWRNMRNTVHIRAANCGDATCGTVIWAVPQAKSDTRDKTGRSLIGMQLFRNFRPTDTNVWKGKIYIPDMDSTASGKIMLTDHQSITVSGCVLAGIICKTQHWKRIG